MSAPITTDNVRKLSEFPSATITDDHLVPIANSTGTVGSKTSVASLSSYIIGKFTQDKEYDPINFSGLGKVYLKKNIVTIGGVEKNILTQSAFYKDGTQIPNTDTMFVVQYDFDLNGETIEIPEESVLEFDGGSISNGTINGNGAAIIDGDGVVNLNNVSVTPFSFLDGSFSYVKESMLIKGTKDYNSALTFWDENGVQSNCIYYIKGLSKIYVKRTLSSSKVIAVYLNFFDESKNIVLRTPYSYLTSNPLAEYAVPESAIYCGITLVEYSSNTKYRRFKLNPKDIANAGIITNLLSKDSVGYNLNVFSTETEDIKHKQNQTFLPDFSINPATLAANNKFNIGGALESARWYINYSDGYSTAVIDLRPYKSKGYDTIFLQGKEGANDETAIRYSFTKSIPSDDEQTTVEVEFADGAGTTNVIYANGTLTIPIPASANYLALMLCNSSTTYLPKSIIFKDSNTGKLNALITEYRQKDSINTGMAMASDGYVQKEIRIGTWNIGHYTGGTTYYPNIPAEDVDAQYNSFMGVVNSMTCDIMGVNEFSEFFGKNSNNITRYGQGLFSEKFRKFYHFEQNYYADNAVASNIDLLSIEKRNFSNMPAVWRSGSLYDKILNDYYILCRTYINNHVVTIVFTHLTWQGGVEPDTDTKYQTAQIEELANLPYNNIVIIGDFNADTNGSYTNTLDYFTEHGFSVAHNIPTCGDRWYDNIVYKGGIIVDNVRVYDSALSDHKPITARIRTTDYTPIDNNRQRVLGFGDAIMRGYRNGEKGVLPYITKGSYRNRGVSQSCFSNNRDASVKSIPQQISEEVALSADFEPDIILIDGGFCDYYFNYPCGIVTNEVITADTAAAAIDQSTMVGGMEYAFYQLIKKWPKARRVYFPTHKVLDYATTGNSTYNLTLTYYFDAAKKVCEKYGVVYVDLFNECSMNTVFNQYIADESYEDAEDKALWNRTYFCDSDGIHPSDLGYRTMYAPIINKYIK